MSYVAPLDLGTMTPWGPIEMTAMTGGERYYWMCASDGSVAMMPHDVVAPVAGEPEKTIDEWLAELGEEE